MMGRRLDLAEDAVAESIAVERNENALGGRVSSSHL